MDHDLKVISEGLELLVGILGAQRMSPRLLFSEEVNAPHDDGGHERQRKEDNAGWCPETSSNGVYAFPRKRRFACTASCEA